MKALKIIAAVILSLSLLALQMSVIAVRAVRDSMTSSNISDSLRSLDLLCFNSRSAPILTITAGVMLDSYLSFNSETTTADGFDGLNLTDEDIKAINDTLGQEDLADILCTLIARNAEELGIDPERSGEIAAAILKTDAAADFIGKYTSELMSSAVYGYEAPVLSSQDITILAGSVIEELPADIKAEIDAGAVQGYITQAAPDISEELNSVAAEVGSIASQTDDNIRIDPETLKAVRFVLSGRMLIILSSLSVIIGILLILLFIKSKAGFLLWAVISAVAAVPYLLIKPAAALLLTRLTEYNITAVLVKPFLNTFQAYGFYMLCFAALLTIVYVVLRLIFNRKSVRDYTRVNL